MVPTISTMNELKLVGMTTRFISIMSPKRNNFVKIPELWHRYIAVADTIPNRVGSNAIGLVEVPETKDKEVKEDDELIYMAAAEVTSFDRIPPGMETRVVPSGTVATFIHRGTLDKLQHTMGFIYTNWLPKSGYKRRPGPDLELYGPRFKLNSPESELEIVIPVHKL